MKNHEEKESQKVLNFEMGWYILRLESGLKRNHDSVVL
jgi:hypothetical protein